MLELFGVVRRLRETIQTIIKLIVLEPGNPRVMFFMAIVFLFHAKIELCSGLQLHFFFLLHAAFVCVVL